MQVIANGLVSGVAIALLALAFSAAYLPSRVLHIALAGVFGLVVHLSWACLQAGWPWYIAVLAGIASGVIISVICEAANHWPLTRKDAPVGVHFISSLGIFIILIQVVAVVWGSDAKVFRIGVDSVVAFGPVILTRGQIVTLLAGSAILAGFFFWTHFARLGLRFRALSANPEELALRGYNVRALRLVSFGVSGFLASVSALLVANDVGFDPYGGLPAVLIAIVAAIIGGTHSFTGPVIGGLLLGLSRSTVIWFLGTEWQDAVTFVVLVVFLYFRPQGITGRVQRIEALT